jgi:hypothetical protein
LAFDLGDGCLIDLQDVGELRLRELESLAEFLQILPKTMSRDEVIARESVYKDKLGTRSVGLNRN